MQKNKHVNIIFMGTPDFSVHSLRMLVEEGYKVVAVVTQPDRPVGRKKQLTPTPVKQEALRHHLPVFQPERLKAPESVAQLKALQPDLIVTAAYGQILPVSVLHLPKYGCINIHASLLPRYRGGAPIQYAIMKGEDKTGITLMYMAEGLDTGDIISQVEVAIASHDDCGTMHDKLSSAGTLLLKTTLPDLLDGKLKGIPQNHQESSYAPNISKEDERIHWERSSIEIYNQVRALHPWPIAFTTYQTDRLKVWNCKLTLKSDYSKASSVEKALPGTVLQCSDLGIEVKTGDGSIWLTKIQLAGKRPMDVAQFHRGSIIPEGTIFGGDHS